MTTVGVFNNGDNATAFDNQSSCTDCSPAAVRLYYVVFYAAITVGIPGNILSAIVWFRRRVENSSAIYLAALAVNDLLHLPLVFVCTGKDYCYDQRNWLCGGAHYVFQSTATLETLLVLGFSIERLIAITCPLQVCRFCVM